MLYEYEFELILKIFNTYNSIQENPVIYYGDDPPASARSAGD